MLRPQGLPRMAGGAAHVMRPTRLAFILVPMLLSAALIGTLGATLVSVRSVLVTLVRGQGDTILDALASPPGGRLEPAFAEGMLAEQWAEGLRCIAGFDAERRLRFVAGECAAEGEPALREALAGSGSEALEVGTRVRMARNSAEPILVEFEPLMRRQLEAGAVRSLGIGGAASLALVAVALGLWRFSIRQERLEAAIERDRRLASLGEMAAVLAHEIRNPLASMKGHAQLLAEKLADGTREREKAERVVREAVRLEELSTDLLGFVRSEQIDAREVDPRAVLEAAADDAGPERIRLELAEGPASWVLDARLVQQALANLLRNAVQASPEGEPARATVFRDGAALVFEIRDRGDGVPAADRERIFEPFVTSRARGTGLGLAVARRVVRLHGGDIEVDDARGGGALFRVRLPVRRPG